MSKPLRALIVEDSPDDAWLLTKELQRGGFEVACERVETAEALQAALASERWNIVLCDFTLPRFSGRQALELTRASGVEIPFIYVSGTIGEDVAVEAMKAGAHDYVIKNNLKRLVPAVERELREAELRRQGHRSEAERQRLLLQLQRTNREVKRLRGLISICGHCKKVENERGQWQQLELFLEEHTEAHFHRGICPDCLHRFDELSLEDKLRD